MTARLPKKHSVLFLGDGSMLATTVKEIAKWCSGKIVSGSGDEVITEIATDSRSVKCGSAFVALRGERYDGHQFITDAITRGARAVIVQRVDAVPKDANVSTIVVEDTLIALGEIAHSYLEQMVRRSEKKVVAVTGSSGKTTTKMMISAILAHSTAVLSSPESYNNEIGIPITLLNLLPEHEVIVLEYATRHIGDIAYLCRIAKPHVGVITNVGKAHIGILGSKEAIEKAKGELIESLDEDGYAVLNADDDSFERMKARTKAHVLTFSMSNPRCDAFASNVHCGLLGTSFDAHVMGRKFTVKLPMLGIHNVSNALAAILACVAVKGEIDEDSLKALESFEPPKMRMQLHERSDGVTIINDAYNANPESMRAALQGLSLFKGAKRRIAVLGEMRELGEISNEEHFKLGFELADYDVNLAVVVGDGARPIADGVRERMRRDPAKQDLSVIEVDSPDEAVDKLRGILRSGDVVLVKASRAVELDRVVKQLLE
jgi:UDP-N-acetylmuramoyl-tripeptide--D-alanyl-D-alanine ligase